MSRGRRTLKPGYDYCRTCGTSLEPKGAGCTHCAQGPRRALVYPCHQWEQMQREHGNGWVATFKVCTRCGISDLMAFSGRKGHCQKHCILFEAKP